MFAIFVEALEELTETLVNFTDDDGNIDLDFAQRVHDLVEGEAWDLESAVYQAAHEFSDE